MAGGRQLGGRGGTGPLLADVAQGVLTPRGPQLGTVQDQVSALKAGEAGGKSKRKGSRLLRVNKSPSDPTLYPGSRWQR